MITISVFVFCGCSGNKKIKFHQESLHDYLPLTKESPTGSFIGAEVTPLATIPKGEWNHIAGWLTNAMIIYVTDVGDGGNLYTYHLYSGKSELLFEVDDPIVEVVISPSKEYILIHTAPTTYSGHITVIDMQGTELFQAEVESFELSFQWNIFDENEIFISSFNEDWSFQANIVQIDKQKMIPIQISDPFPQWMAQDVLAFLQWDVDEPSLTAPLVSYQINNQEERVISPQVIEFFSFRDYLLTVNINEQENLATYTFLHKQKKENQLFEAPLLTRFSGWLVPFYTMNESDQLFYTFRSIRSADADLYGDKFQLVTYDLKSNEEEIGFEGLDNEPILLSPDGKNILYGYQFEKMIQLESKKVIEIVELD